MSKNYFLITNFNNGPIGRNGALSINEFERDAEIVLVDDGSEDVELQRSYYNGIKNLRFISLGRDEGYVYAVNYGMNVIMQELAECHWADSIIVIFDVDAQLLEPVCDSFKQSFESDGHIGAITVSLIDHSGTPTGNVSRYPHFLDVALGQRLSQFIGGAKKGKLIHSCFMAVKPAAWEAVGPLDLRFSFLAADMDWGMRMLKKGFRSEIISSLRAIHPGGGTGMNAAKRVLLWTAATGTLFAKHGLFTRANWLPFMTVLTLRITLEIIVAAVARLFRDRYKGIFRSRTIILEGFVKSGCYRHTSESAWMSFMTYSNNLNSSTWKC